MAVNSNQNEFCMGSLCMEDRVVFISHLTFYQLTEPHHVCQYFLFINVTGASLTIAQLLQSTFSVFPFPDSLLERPEGVGQCAQIWWDPHSQPLHGGQRVLPVLRRQRRRGEGARPPEPPAEEWQTHQTAPQAGGHGQRRGRGRGVPAALRSSEQVHHRVSRVETEA